MYLYEYDPDDYREYCEDYAMRHPIYELGKIVGYTYPNGSVRYVEDEEEINNTCEYY